MPSGSPGESCSSLPSQSLPDQDSAPTFCPRDQPGLIHTLPGSRRLLSGGGIVRKVVLWVARVGIQAGWEWAMAAGSHRTVRPEKSPMVLYK